MKKRKRKRENRVSENEGEVGKRKKIGDEVRVRGGEWRVIE